jgi:hypothetical protein
VSITPTPVTAALAGIFSGLSWPLIWPFVTGTDASATLWLVLATIVLVALPAHAFVLGFQRREATGARTVDVALLARIASWLAAGVLTALLVAMSHAST